MIMEAEIYISYFIKKIKVIYKLLTNKVYFVGLVSVQNKKDVQCDYFTGGIKMQEFAPILKEIAAHLEKFDDNEK